MPKTQIAPSVARAIEAGDGTHAPVSADCSQASFPAGVNFRSAPATAALPEERDVCIAVPPLGSRSTSPAYRAAT